MQSVRFEIADCRPAAVETLRRALGVGAALAQILVRRGLADVAKARAFLYPQESHPPGAFAGIDAALETILRQTARAGRITVHGDYDVDGVCATALMVEALRTLGARVDWHIPDRAAGYGLRRSTVEALAARGSELLITVDCGITAVEEVKLARSLGMEVVISDHHAPRADGRLPCAPIVHPSLCGYPYPQLCGTAVAYKLAQALFDVAGRDASELDADLDLVAMASIADVVELLGENRTLVARGLRALASTSRPGLRALMEVARIDLSRLDARAVAFGLAPRINAAGRLYSAAPALELLLTREEQRAAELAGGLERCNRERREVEQRILFDAQAQLRQLGPMPAYVLAGEGWHPGVIGIVASRVAEQTGRPAVLVALDGGRGRGSGRSIPAFDLLEGLGACAEHLLAYGGHRAAAGLELELDRIEGFRAAFAAHAQANLSGRDLVPIERVDAIVSVAELGLPLAEELASLAPFGHGNPAATLMARGVQVADVRGMGEGKHARFRLLGDGAQAAAVYFGAGPRLAVEEGQPVDATFRLEINEWRGVCEPRVVVRHVQPSTHSLPSVEAEDERLAVAREPLQLALAVP